MLAATNGWDTLSTLIAATPGIVAAVVVLAQHRKITAIDNAVNGREEGEPTMSEESAANAARNAAQDVAATDPTAPAEPGSADRAASSAADEAG